METCDDCGNPVQFLGYAYWEIDELLDHLVLDNPELTPEDETYYCPHCDIKWAVLLNADGTKRDMHFLEEMGAEIKARFDAGEEFESMDDILADMVADIVNEDEDDE